MKPIKMLGLAVIAVLAAMAFVGAGTAAANNGTILCHLGSGTQGHCPAGELPYTGKILALGGTSETLGWSLFKSGEIHIECNTDMTGNITSAGGLGAVPLGLINTVSFTECKSPECQHGVTAVAHNLPWLAKGSVGGEATLGDGFLNVEKHASAAGKPGGLFTCKTLVFGFPTNVTCGYDIEGTSAQALFDGHRGHGQSKLLANDIKLERVHGSGFLCSTTSTWRYLPFVDGFEGATAQSDLSLHLL